MTTWDLGDRDDFLDFQDEARRDRREEARRDAGIDEDNERSYLHCGDCGFQWTTGWSPSVEAGRRKVAEDPYRCPRCGSMKKESR